VIVSAATLSPTAYWYLTRATGIVSLLLLTAVVVLGVIGPMRLVPSPGWPRFAVDSLHRDLSLLAIVLIALHVIFSVADGFAPITLVDGVIPFNSPYRPLWLGLGALAFDLMLALVITSLVRRRLGYGAWRAVHWLAYACWPIAVLHGLGTGSDSRQLWTLAVTFLCVGVVAWAIIARVRRADKLTESQRALGVAAATLTPLGLLLFTFVGPLNSNWAITAGTPRHLLASYVHRPASAASTTTPASSATSTAQLKLPFTSRLAGTISQQQASGGAILDIELHLTGATSGSLRIRLGGQPVGGGGLSLSGSQVDLAPTGLPAALVGRVTELNGTQVAALVTGDHQPVDLLVDLHIDEQTRTVSGVVHAKRAG
jgi:DMSO/TMAO reductase YedYZ heme-binding membrane subunit